MVICETNRLGKVSGQRAIGRQSNWATANLATNIIDDYRRQHRKSP